MTAYPLIAINDSLGGTQLSNTRQDNKRSVLGFYFIYRYQIDFLFSLLAFLSLFSRLIKRVKKEA
jgi:hypothetical protein